MANRKTVNYLYLVHLEDCAKYNKFGYRSTGGHF